MVPRPYYRQTHRTFRVVIAQKCWLIPRMNYVSHPSPPSPGQSGRPTAAPADRLIGRVLEERYRIDAKLARGGMSTVYRGIDLRLERPVAIKVMAPAYAADPTFLTRFEREARAAAKLDNPHVVGVYDQGRDGDDVFLIMELVVGGTLRDLIHERGDLSVPVALAILEPILAALGAAHEAGLVHRDVKPENVLISHQGDVKVADFGLVRALASTTMATGNVILGTVAYLSPEQVDTGASDQRSDVYSAGIVGYEMLTGKPPYTGENPMSVAYQHVHEDVPSVAAAAPGVPAAITAIIDTATRRDPLVRPHDANDFLARLEQARADIGMTLPAIPPPSTALRAAQQISTATTGQNPTRQATRRAPVPIPTSPQTAARRAARAAQAQRRWRRRLLVLVTVAALAIAAALGGWWLAEQWTSMPTVTDLPEIEALEALDDASLVAVMTTAFHNVIPSGSVIASQPEAEVRQKKGATVTLSISAGQPVIPDIAVGTEVIQAATMLRAVGLQPVVDQQRATYDNAVAEGGVLRTDPAQGEAVPVGSAVTLIVSRGPAPMTVPDVAGKLLEDAKNKLLVDGFTIGPQQNKFAADVSAGTVLGTTPSAGSTAAHGSPVSLVLAISKTVPNITDGTIADVTAQLRRDGFDVRVGEPIFDANVPGGQLVELNPAPGTRIDPAKPIITLTPSNAVTVPSVTGITIGEAIEDLEAAELNYIVRSLFGRHSSLVVNQNPIAGELVAPESVVVLNAWP